MFIARSLVGISLLLASCQSSEGSLETTVVTGYQPAIGENTIYVPLDVDTGSEDYEKDFGEVGRAFQMMVGIDVNKVLVLSGNPVVRHKFRLKLILDSIENTGKFCVDLTGTPNSYACTEIGEVCRVHVSKDMSPYVWGHELWHCIDGYYHGAG